MASEIQGIMPVQVSSLDQIKSSDFIAYSQEAGGSTFLDLINKMNNDVEAPNKLIADYILKKDVSTHDVMIALEQAKHTLQIATEVRNKVVEAYEKIINIRV